jgi:hypothetical protein
VSSSGNIHLTADPLERVVEKYVSFLNNLEQWVDANMNRGGIQEQELIDMINDSYKRSLEANVGHYEFMARANQDVGDMAASKRYSLMARIYKALIE